MNKNANKEPRANIEPEEVNPQFIDGIIGYVANSVVSRTILKKSTTTISVLSFDNGEGLTEKTSPFDSFFHILEGHAEIVIEKDSHLLELGQGIIVPANSSYFIRPNGRFKMILTIIQNRDDRIAML
jgi:quercetin dioxygenase-like cupin family protein